jgi:hypothetical protein
VFVDPRPWTLAAARSLRARGVEIVALSGSRLEPTIHARGVQGHHLPPLTARPERWSARLLELAARLEPRAVLFGCTHRALQFLDAERRSLEPHFMLANLADDGLQATGLAPDAALRHALLRGDAGLEVQIARTRRGERAGSCVLAWALGAPPDVLVTSVESAEVEARSADLLESRCHVGYARIVWAPDRFGRLAAQAASVLPGPSIELAAAHGVDFPALAYAIATDQPIEPQRARPGIVRRLHLVDPDECSEEAPLVDFVSRLAPRDPLPWLAGMARALLRP